MDWIEALILGIIQGLTEYLPVSSSGHLAIGQALFGMQDGEENLMFTVAVHVATILSTLVVLWKEISWIVKGVFKFEMNAETKYFLNIVVSMIPVGIVGLFFSLARDLRPVDRGLLPAADGCPVDLLLFCPSASKGTYLVERCLRDWYCPGLCRAAWPVAFWFYHRHGTDAG